MAEKCRVAVFVSGSGTNLQAIIDAGIEEVEIVLTVSNKADVFALKRAENHDIPVEVVDHRAFKTREDFDSELVRRLEPYSVDLVVLAGFMRILTPTFIAPYKHRIMNIHPALLPSFPGVNAVEQAFVYGVKQTGCTVHFINEGVDTGPIIVQAVVPVEDSDTLESLTEKIHVQEHRIYPEAVKLFAQGRVKVEGRRVRIA